MVKILFFFYLSLMVLFVSCGSYDKNLESTTPIGIKIRTGHSLRDEKDKSELPPGIDLAKPLSVHDAAAIAIWNNAQLAADLAQLGLAKSDMVEAGLIRNPRMDMLFPVGLKPFELMINLPLEAIWERPSKISAAEKAYEQLAETMVHNGLTTVLNTRIAHADLVLAKKREEILNKAAELRGRIAKINNSQRVRTGELTKVEGIATQVDFASSEELWMRAKHDTTLARMRLRLMLGLMMNSSQIDVEVEKVAITVPPPIEELIEKALASRPDLRAAELSVIAATKRARWEKVRVAQLSVLLSAKGVGTYGILYGPGISAELPIFNQNDGRRMRADSEVLQASKQYLALKQRVVFEISEARQLLEQAQEVLFRTKEKVLPLLTKSVALAEKEYKFGTASYLFVLEQTRALVDAQMRIAEFEAAVMRAEAVLKRGLGAG